MVFMSLAFWHWGISDEVILLGPFPELIIWWHREQLLLFLERASKPKCCLPGSQPIPPFLPTHFPKRHLFSLWKIAHSQIVFLSSHQAYFHTETDSGMSSWMNHAITPLFIGAACRQRFWCKLCYGPFIVCQLPKPGRRMVYQWSAECERGWASGLKAAWISLFPVIPGPCSIDWTVIL